MGLVGRLEDLPIADIVQIVYLSRGSGILELRVAEGRHAIMFSKGRMVNASSPLIRNLRDDLEDRLNAGPLERLLDSTKPVGVAALERQLITPLDLGKLVFQRLATVVRGLTEIRKGEFEFIAREPSVDEIEFDTARIFKRGGIRPEDILGKRAAGLEALVTVKQSLKSAIERSPLPHVQTQPAPAASIPDRCIVVLEDDVAARDAVRGSSAVHGFAMIEARDAANVIAVLDRDGFVLAVLGLGADPDTIIYPLIRDIKTLKPHTPIVVLDGTSDFRRRHSALEAGADLYMRKPAQGADEERAVFVEDLMLFVERRFAERKSEPAQGPMNRGFRLLVQMLEEVSSPGDMSQLSLTILQLAADYVDRGVLLARKGSQFITLGRFGVRGNGATPHLSILERVVATGRAFRGSVDAAAAAELESAFGAADVREAIALPILSGNNVVGVLYGDNGVHQRPIDDTLGLEVFLSQAGFAVQNMLMGDRPLAEKLSGKQLQPA